MKAAEDERKENRKENKKYIQNYFAKTKAHKEFIKKQNEYRKITDIKEQNKLNLKEYHKTAEYKEFNKKQMFFFNSKTKKQLEQCGIKHCPELYKKNDKLNINETILLLYAYNIYDDNIIYTMYLILIKIN
jgi:hypothetical protein